MTLLYLSSFHQQKNHWHFNHISADQSAIGFFLLPKQTSILAVNVSANHRYVHG